MRFLAAVVTFIVVGFVALIGFFFVLVMLNGFSDSDGGVALQLYGIVAVVGTVGSAAATPALTGWFDRRAKSSPALVACLLASGAGSALLITGGLGALVLASLLRAM